jgi:hypothetical protein
MPWSTATRTSRAPGFGLELDEDAFGRAVRDGGYSLTA